MKRLINYTIVFLLLTTNIFADERERQTRKVADAANAAKSCISNIPSQLNNIKYQLINAHNSLTKEIQSNLRDFLPEKFSLEFSDEGYIGLDITRKEIFSNAFILSQYADISDSTEGRSIFASTLLNIS